MVTGKEPANPVAPWLSAALERKGVAIALFARRAGVSKSTIYRALDPDYEGSIGFDNLMKISRELGEPLPANLTGPAGAPAGFAESELHFLGDDSGTLPEMTRGADQGVWEVRGRLLELAGYLPGDRVLVDMGVEPRPGDVVCAQVYSFSRGTAETVLRLYQPPYLVTATLDRSPAARPLWVDNERVSVRGTVVLTMRPRAA